ncbi:MAG: hypothetical protein J1F42_05940 [Lachnospiraceae bacterium]|nr:hypothetical protein [Lachnospiraceae bacterium]
MKKKTLAVLLAISCTLSMAACGASGDNGDTSAADEAREALAEEFEEEEPEEEIEEEPEVEEEQEEEEEEPEEEEVAEPKKAASAPSELSDDLYDFQVSIDGIVYQFPMWYSDFEALGWEFQEDATDTLSSNQYTFGATWKKDGFRVSTRLANLSMNTVPFSESMVASITLDKFQLKDCDWEIILPGGIQWGVSNTDDIIAAYGDPSDDYEGDMYYKMTYEIDSYSEINLYVYKEEDALLEIEIENMVALEGADNSVNEEVPDLVKEYKAPKSLGSDFYAYTAELEGVVYSLPCPVSVLLENGFTIDTSNSDSVVAAGRNGWVNLRYNNQTLRTMVKNYADYATTVENCFALSMKSSVNGPEFDLVFPGNIKVGDAESAVKKAVDGFNCEVETSDSGYTYYEIADPDKSVLDKYTIVVKDGKVQSMEIENATKPEY